MKTIILKNGQKQVVYRPSEVGPMIGYHPKIVGNMVRMGAIKAVNLSFGASQPRWWIPKVEVRRIKQVLLRESFASYMRGLKKKR